MEWIMKFWCTMTLCCTFTFRGLMSLICMRNLMKLYPKLDPRVGFRKVFIPCNFHHRLKTLQKVEVLYLKSPSPNCIVCLSSLSAHSNLVSSLKNSLDLSYISCFISLPTGSSFTWSSKGHGNVAAWNVLRGTGAYFAVAHVSSHAGNEHQLKWLKWKKKS